MNLAAGDADRRLIVEDYTELAGSQAANIAPGKFVHLQGPDRGYLLLSRTSRTPYHAQIVQLFCSRHPGVEIVMHAKDEGELVSPGWFIRGGGYFRHDRDSCSLWLWGSSKAYGPFQGAFLRTRLMKLEPWTSYQIFLEEPHRL